MGDVFPYTRKEFHHNLWEEKRKKKVTKKILLRVLVNQRMGGVNSQAEKESVAKRTKTNENY